LKIMNKGVTLIETVIYFTLFSGLMSLVLPILIELDRFQIKQQHTAESINVYMYVDEHVRGLVRTASEIVEPESGEISNRLVVRNSEGQEIYFEPQDEFSTSTKMSELRFSRSFTFGFETIEFATEINGINFGTTTYVFYK